MTRRAQSQSSNELTSYQLKVKRAQDRREKARIRMAKKRAELKLLPMEQQQLAAERDRQHQATYREKNREDLRIWEADRRAAVYEATYGPEAYTLYLKARRDRRRRARDKRRAKEGYFPQAIPSGVAPERRGDVDDGRRSAH